jgi:hypothetical protein
MGSCTLAIRSAHRLQFSPPASVLVTEPLRLTRSQVTSYLWQHPARIGLPT